MKKLALLIPFLICVNAAAIELDDVKMPLPVEYRLGTSDEVETKYEIIETDMNTPEATLQKEKKL